jgi:outer membrane protein assembly factor BamB
LIFVYKTYPRGSELRLRGLVCMFGVGAILALVVAGWAWAGSSLGYQVDAARSGGLSTDPLAPPLVRAWAVDLPSPQTNPQFSYPVIDGGRVFVTGWRYGAPSSLYGLDLATGRVDWGPLDIGGDGHWSGLTDDGGSVFTVADDGTVTAVDPAAGSVRWRTQLGSPVDAEPVAAAGVLYVATSASLVALSESSGTVLWARSIVDGSHASPAVANGDVFVSGVGEQTYAFDASGAQLWHHDTGSAGSGGRAVAVYGGRVYVRDDSGDTPTVLNATNGAVVGTFAATTIPAFSGSKGFFLRDGVLSAHDLSTGDALWSFAADTSFTVAPIVVGGYVYDGDFAGNLYAIDIATGQAAWSTNVGANINPPDEHNSSGPLAGLGAANGYLVVPVWYQGTGSPFELVAYRASSLSPPPSPPDTQITARPDATTTATSAQFSFLSSPAGATFRCSLDGAPFTGCLSPQTYNGLSLGSHTFGVEAVDSSNGTDPSPATWAWSIQSPPPPPPPPPPPSPPPLAPPAPPPAAPAPAPAPPAAPQAPSVPPAATSMPATPISVRIVGPVVVGGHLHAVVTGSRSTAGYRWQLCHGTRCAEIANAVAQRLTIKPRWLGARLRATVTINHEPTSSHMTAPVRRG